MNLNHKYSAIVCKNDLIISFSPNDLNLQPRSSGIFYYKKKNTFSTIKFYWSYLHHAEIDFDQSILLIVNSAWKKLSVTIIAGFLGYGVKSTLVKTMIICLTIKYAITST